MMLRSTCLLPSALLGVLLVLLLGLLLGAGSVRAADGADFAPDSAHARVQEATEALMAVLAAHRDDWDSDRSAIFAAVDTAMAPYVDYPAIARGVMARYWRQADEAQRQAFTEAFRESLVKSYTSALMEFDIARIEVLPDDGRASRPDRAVVRMTVYTTDGKAYPLEYAMACTADGAWLVRNVVVNGANLGLTWRNQFAGSMRGSDLDTVISTWGAEQVAAGADVGTGA